MVIQAPARPRRSASHALILGLLAAVVLALAPARAEARPDVGDRAPEFVAVKDEKGRKVRMRAYKKGWVVMTIGGSWCKPCRKELPAWDKLAKAYKPRGVTFIALNGDANVSEGKAFMKEAGVKNMVKGYDPDQSSISLWDPEHMPTTYVVDPKGIVRHVHPTYESGDEDKLAKALDALLK